MKKKCQISWIGESDHKVAETPRDDNVGPIANALLARTRYDHMFLLTDYPHQRSVDYCNWLEEKASYKEIDLRDIDFSSPTNYAEIYQNVCKTLSGLKLPTSDMELTFHLSPCAPAMAAIWIMFAKTPFPATLIQTSKKAADNGKNIIENETANFPFNFANDFLPEFLKRTDAHIECFGVCQSSSLH